MKKAISIMLIVSLTCVLCACSSTATAAPANSEIKNTVDFSSYSREELISMRDAINNILGESTTSTTLELTSNAKQFLPEAPNGDLSPVSDFIYASNGSEVQINGYAGPGGNIVIPSEIDGLPVTRIAQKAFDNCSNITGLVLPDTLEIIGEWAFGSVQLTDAGVLVLPSSLKEVGNHAFAYSGFSGIVIKCNCKFTCTFEQMRNLRFVCIAEGASPILETRAFGYGESLEIAIIPSSVSSIKTDDVFYGSNTVTIYTPTNSTAAAYGMRNFISVNSDDYNKMIEQYSVY